MTLLLSIAIQLIQIINSINYLLCSDCGLCFEPSVLSQVLNVCVLLGQFNLKCRGSLLGLLEAGLRVIYHNAQLFDRAFKVFHLGIEKVFISFVFCGDCFCITKSKGVQCCAIEMRPQYIYSFGK